MNTYKLHRILTWPTNHIAHVCHAWAEFLWYYCHYRYGKFSEINGSPCRKKSIRQAWRDAYINSDE